MTLGNMRQNGVRGLFVGSPAGYVVVTRLGETAGLPAHREQGSSRKD
jgi:hypothetical protein